MTGSWKKLSGMQRSLLASAGCHALFFLLTTTGYGLSLGENAKPSAPRAAAASLQADFREMPGRPAPPAILMTSDSGALVPTDAASQASPERMEHAMPEKEEPPADAETLPEKSDAAQIAAAETGAGLGMRSPPELVSEFSPYIFEPSLSGSLILSLDIDAKGQARKAEVVRTDLSPFITRLLEKRFLGATFKPAQENGMPVEATIEVKVVIESTNISRVMDGT